MTEPATPGIERRQHERRPLRSTAHLLFPDRQPIEVRTFDISLGGLGIIASANPPLRTAYSLRINIPIKLKGSTPFEVQAEVTHSVYSGSENGFKIGLRFLSPPPALAAVIVQFLQV